MISAFFLTLAITSRGGGSIDFASSVYLFSQMCVLGNWLALAVSLATIGKNPSDQPPPTRSDEYPSPYPMPSTWSYDDRNNPR